MNGWKPPKEGDAVKREANWTMLEEKVDETNTRVVNAIFGALSEQVHTLISKSEIGKDAWSLLATTYEGTSKVKESRMQMLTTRVETLTMRKDESVAEFIEQLMKIANYSCALEETINNEKLVKKALRGLQRSLR